VIAWTEERRFDEASVAMAGGTPRLRASREALLRQVGLGMTAAAPAD
jgi:hypothetical protein